jgi:hypothetical protein
MNLEDLLLALEMTTPSSRAALLKATPAKVREELAAQLAYREMCNVPANTLLVALDAAVDNAERAALLKAATPKERKALADDIWLRNASEVDAARHYRDMVVTEEMPF